MNNHRQTALHLAVWDPDALHLLLQHKADVNAADENGTTPLMAALEEKEVEPLVVEYLLEAKVGNLRKFGYMGSTWRIHRKSWDIMGHKLT